MFFIFVGKFYTVIWRRNLFQNGRIAISMFLSFENLPLDSLHLRETLDNPE
jgi:hypothetical protein